jgi:maleylacetoacetate isomerase
MKLYGYWRSTAAYRVRIALAIKAIEFDNISVHLVKDGGEQFKDDYVALNPAKLVPTLVDGEVVLSQSMAIMEYLEEKFDHSPLLPTNVTQRAQVRSMAQDIGCDIHPLNNLRILKYLKGELNVTDEAKSAWYAHWIQTGFAALEAKLKNTAGKYCFGDEVTMADLCLIPQLYNAHRFAISLADFPIIRRVERSCNEHPAFITAAPENQPDASA